MQRRSRSGLRHRICSSVEANINGRNTRCHNLPSKFFEILEKTFVERRNPMRFLRAPRISARASDIAKIDFVSTHLDVEPYGEIRLTTRSSDGNRFGNGINRCSTAVVCFNVESIGSWRRNDAFGTPRTRRRIGRASGFARTHNTRVRARANGRFRCDDASFIA